MSANKRKLHFQEKLQVQNVLNAMLSVSLKPYSLEEMLDRILEIVTSIPWLTLQSMGAIFLVLDKPDELVMKSFRGKGKEARALCARIPFGKCLCGLAASTGEIQFADSIDDRHEITYKGISPHGHYCVPIISSGGVLGVLNLDMSKDHQHCKEEEDFLRTMAKVLAGIIARKRVEKELAEHRHQLEKLVGERTAELMEANEQLKQEVTERKRCEEELRKAKDAAEAASRAKSRFLANMSHEIRTPMHGIIGMTKITLNTDLTETQNKYLHLVEKSANDLLFLINDILDFSKIEAGKYNPEKIDFELRDCLDHIIEVLALKAAEKNLKLTCNVHPNVPDFLTGDPGQLRQVIFNLINNAIKFTKQGGVVLNVERKSRVENDVFLHFAVADTGIGIPADKQQLIFDPFSQADSSITRKYGGTGLGLAICSQLVKMMNGRIWLESEEGKGSTFYFIGRFGRRRTSKIKPVPANQEGSLVTRHSLREDQRHLHVLLAEDNPINQEMAIVMLSTWGYTVVVTNNGNEALDALEKESFDLVLMDVQMPEMDGFEATTAIRKIEKETGEHIPIIAITAHAMKRDRQLCLHVGMDGYVSKPVNADKLMEVIKTLVFKDTVTKPGDSEKNNEEEKIIPVPAEAGMEELTSRDEESIFDKEDFIALFFGDMELFKKVVGMFIDKYPQMLSEIHQAINSNDNKVLEHAAHALKGSISHFTSNSAFDAALKLEIIGRNEDLIHAEEAYVTLEKEIERLKQALVLFGQDITE